MTTDASNAMLDVFGEEANTSEQLSDVELIQTHCEELFSLHDFVIEPQVISTLLAFFQAGGQPERVIDLLSSNYQGLGQHANLLACWLADLELEDSSLAAVAAGTSASQQLAPFNLLADAQGKIENCATVRDCFESTVCQMIRRQFSSEAVDKIFETDGTEGIDWIPMLISHRSWRRLVYELAEHFPNCLMLNFAFKLISDAGFQHEISNVNTAAQQLDIFSRVFLSSIEHLLSEYVKCEGEQLKESYRHSFLDLKRVACHSEHTFLYTQLLLNYIGWKGSDKKAAICSNIAQQLRIEFEGRQQDIFALQIGMIQFCVDPVSPHIVQAMLTMLAKGLNPADIAQLHQAYSGDNPPPTELIRHSYFLDLLIDALFNANGNRINVAHRPKYIFLLAYACSVAEIKQKKGTRMQKKDQLSQTQEQLEQLANILYSPEDILLSLEHLLRLARTPVLAAGILHYLKTLLLREVKHSLVIEQLEKDLLAEPSPLHFVLIDQVARNHHNLHPKVFSLLCALYDHQSSRNEVAEVVMERQRHVVDRFVHLLCCGMALPVLEKIVAMFKGGHIDISLVRYFGVEVLELVAPPYSKQFVDAFLPVVANTEVFDRATLEKHPTAKEFLSAF